MTSSNNFTNAVTSGDEQFYVFPTSFSQQRLWFLNQLAPDNIAYNVPAAIRIGGSLNIAALEESLSETIRRHEALRTTFGVEDGQPVQIIASNWPNHLRILPIIDLTSHPQGERESEARRQVLEDVKLTFDLAKGPLLRAKLIRLDETNHILTIVMHHIISDGWSMEVLVRELSLLYEAFSTGKPSPLSELPIQYADFAVWQREWMQGEVLEKQLAYWRKRLDGANPLLEMPTDHSRPPIQTFRGALEKFELPVEIVISLKALSRQANATLFMTLLAAFYILLYRYTGQQDMVVGTPIANRRRNELNELIGCFVNTLAPRADLGGNPKFCELLARVRESLLDDYLNQDLPFEMLVERLDLSWEPSYNPVFQVMFLFQSQPLPPNELQGLELSYMDTDLGASRFDLSLGMEESGLRGFFEYNTNLFNADTIKRMVSHFRTLLEGVVANPNRRISQLNILTERERHQLLVEWRGADIDHPKDRCVHELVEEQARSNPDAIAIVDGAKVTTFGELDRRSNQLAHRLRAVGVGPEKPVGICMQRSIEWIVGLLGTFKAGGAQVLLDPTYPKDRIAFMMEDSQVPVLITHPRSIESLPAHNAEVIYLDQSWASINQESEESLGKIATGENAAYIVYTSGSTGRPKAVVNLHDSLLNLVLWHQRTFDVSGADRATQVARTGFDASVWELWPYLTAGASIHLLDEETRLSPSKLRDWYVTNGITIGFLPPALAETVLYEHWPDDVTLRILLTGSDKSVLYPPDTLPFKYVNVYGPTEATVIVTMAEIPPAPEADLPPPIGWPLDNTQIYLLDGHLQPVPIGVAGELHIGGAHLARGYWNRPELTAEKFIPNPFGENPGLRLYKTGDLARYQPDGNIEFLGRIDHQVKIRGFRVELGEIESLLCQRPAVQKAVVVVRGDTATDKRIVAYVVSDEGDVLANDLRAFLKAKLPEYMIPAAIMVLDQLPLTPNGKVNRSALPAPDQDRRELESVYVAPRTELEQTIAILFRELLQLERVGLYDNFFDLGAHSVVIARARVILQEKLGLEIPIVEIYKNSSISALTKYLEQEHILPADHSKPQQTQQSALQQGYDRADIRKAQRNRRR